MKVVVTALKAPWPAGATVGSVVEFQGGMVPSWALGKCQPAADDAEVTHAFSAPEFVVNPAAEEAPPKNKAKAK